jgi:hypothetical protein
MKIVAYYQNLYNKNFSKNHISGYISTIRASRAPKFRRMIDYLMDCVNNLVRIGKVIYF